VAFSTPSFDWIPPLPFAIGPVPTNATTWYESSRDRVVDEESALTSVSKPEPDTTSRPDAKALPERWGFVLALLLIIATVALYHSVKRYPFINFDDRDYVIRNFQVQTGLDWDTVQWSFTTFYSSNWHPLTWLSHALDYQLFKLDPAGHHDTSVLFHALNAALLFWVLWRATNYAGRSFMVAGLFALHPINVESVAWISERKNVLSMFFFLLALGAYRWYAQEPHLRVPHPSRLRREGGRVGRYLVVLLLYALGLMAKPQVITFPFVLLLWDYWPLQRIFPPKDGSSGRTQSTALPARSLTWLIVEKLPLFALSAASAVLTIKAQRTTGALNGVFTSYPFSIRLENAIVSYVRYLGKAIWPAHLAVYYPHPESLLDPWQVAGAAVVLLAITALVIAGRRRRYFLVGWFWFLGTLIPMSGLVQVGAQAMADRYAYLPFIGLFLMFCWGVADFQPAAGRADSKWLEEGHTSSTWLTVACIALLVALAAVAHQQLWYWRNSLALWEHAAETTAGNWMAEDMLGAVTLELGKGDLALAHFQSALALNPNDPISNVNIGNWNLYAGHPRDAIEYYQNVLRYPRAPEVLKTKAAEGLQRAYRELGTDNAAVEAPK
jgi:protein O-mannosyl-transferase